MIEPPAHIPNLTRLRWFYAAFMALFGVLIARLWYLQIQKGPELEAMAKERRTRLVRRVAARGSILDAKNRLLATSRPHFVISVMPDEIEKHPDAMPRLAALLKLPQEELEAFLKLNRKTPFDPVPVVEDADIHLLSQIEEQKLDLPGLLLTQDPKRYYPYPDLCAHVLGVTRPISAEKLDVLRDRGYRGGDYIGMDGLEAFYESELRGKDGGQPIEVDARGRMRRAFEEIPPTAGHTLKLTLDLDLQRVAWNSLREELGRGHPGSAVAIDPRDGAVLAMVSAPSYDLNTFGKDYGKFLKDPLTPLQNRALNSYYANGSTYKLVTMSAGLASGTTTPSTGDYCPGYIRIGRMRLHCDNRSGHGGMGFERAIGASCNVYLWHVAQRAGRDAMIATARRFGLGVKPDIDLPASRTARGIVPSPEWKKKSRRGPWVPGDLLNMAIGQGDVGVTPLQLAGYTAAIANGGTLLKPQLAREILDTSGVKPQSLHRLKREAKGSLGLKSEQIAALVAGMERVLQPGGTAGSLAIDGLRVAGKTGSADSFLRHEKVTNSCFVCFAPVENPRIAIAVVVENGGHGARTAAPIARRMLLQYFGIKSHDIPPGHGAIAD